MKKLFTVDDFMVALVVALGYGYGDTIEGSLTEVEGLKDYMLR